MKNIIIIAFFVFFLKDIYSQPLTVDNAILELNYGKSFPGKEFASANPPDNILKHPKPPSMSMDLNFYIGFNNSWRAGISIYNYNFNMNADKINKIVFQPSDYSGYYIEATPANESFCDVSQIGFGLRKIFQIKKLEIEPGLRYGYGYTKLHYHSYYILKEEGSHYSKTILFDTRKGKPHTTLALTPQINLKHDLLKLGENGILGINLRCSYVYGKNGKVTLTTTEKDFFDNYIVNKQDFTSTISAFSVMGGIYLKINYLLNS